MTKEFSGEIDDRFDNGDMRVGYRGYFPTTITEDDQFQVTLWEPNIGGDKLIPYDAAEVRTRVDVGGRSQSSGWIETASQMDFKYSAFNLGLSDLDVGEHDVTVRIDARHVSGVTRTATHTGRVEVIANESELRIGSPSIQSPADNTLIGSVEVTNEITSGDGEPVPVEASYSGATSQQRSTTTQPGETVRFEFEETDVRAGDYTVTLTVAGETTAETVEVTTTESDLSVGSLSVKGYDAGVIETRVPITNTPVAGGGRPLDVEAVYSGVDYLGDWSLPKTVTVQPGETVEVSFVEGDLRVGDYTVEVTAAGETRSATVSVPVMDTKLGSQQFAFDGESFTVHVGNPRSTSGGVSVEWDLRPGSLRVVPQLVSDDGSVVDEDPVGQSIFGPARSSGRLTALEGGDYTVRLRTLKEEGPTFGRVPISLSEPGSYPDSDPNPAPDPDPTPDPAPEQEPEPDPEPVVPPVEAACDFAGAEITAGDTATVPVDVTSGDGDTETSATVQIEAAGQTATETVTLSPNSSARVEATFEITEPGEYVPTITLE